MFSEISGNEFELGVTVRVHMSETLGIIGVICSRLVLVSQSAHFPSIISQRGLSLAQSIRRPNSKGQTRRRLVVHHCRNVFIPNRE